MPRPRTIKLTETQSRALATFRDKLRRWGITGEDAAYEVCRFTQQLKRPRVRRPLPPDEAPAEGLTEAVSLTPEEGGPQCII